VHPLHRKERGTAPQWKTSKDECEAILSEGDVKWWVGASPVTETPLDGNFSLIQFSEMFESAHRQVKGVFTVTSGAVVRDGHNNSVSVQGVHDLHLLPTEGRGIALSPKLDLIFDQSEFQMELADKKHSPMAAMRSLSLCT
jgi:hypothetical protein